MSMTDIVTAIQNLFSACLEGDNRLAFALTEVGVSWRIWSNISSNA